MSSAPVDVSSVTVEAAAGAAPVAQAVYPSGFATRLIHVGQVYKLTSLFLLCADLL